MNKKEITELLNDKKKFEEIARKGFNEVDINKSGKIDFEEVERVLKNFARGNGLPPPSMKEIEDVYTKLDKDKSGKIDFEEFLVFFESFLNVQ